MDYELDFGPTLREEELWQGFRLSSIEVSGEGLAPPETSTGSTDSGVTNSLHERCELPVFWRRVEALEVERGEVHEKGCSLEVVLRRLTSLYACSSFDVWSFLLQLRTFMKPRALMVLLVRRYVSASPRDESARNVRLALAQSDAQRSDAQRSDAQQSDAQRSDAQRSDAQQSDAQQSDAQHSNEQAGFATRLSIAVVLEIWLSSFPEDFLSDSLEGIHLRNPAVDVVVGTDAAISKDSLVADDEGDVMDVLCRFLLCLEEDGMVSPIMSHDHHRADMDGSVTNGQRQRDLQMQPSVGVLREICCLLLAMRKFAKTRDVLEGCVKGGEHDKEHDELRVSFCGEEEASDAADMRLPAIVEASMAARRCIVPSVASSTPATVFRGMYTEEDENVDVGKSGDINVDHVSETILRLSRPCDGMLRKMVMMQLGDVMVRALRPVIEQYSNLAATLAVTELQSLASNIDDMAQRSVADGRIDTNVRLFNSAVDKMFISIPNTDLSQMNSASVFDTEEDDGASQLSGGFAMNAKGESFQDRLSMAFEATRQSEASVKKTRRRLSGRHSTSGSGSRPSSAPSSTVASPVGSQPSTTSRVSDVKNEIKSMPSPNPINPFDIEPVKQKWRPGFFMRKLGRRLSGGRDSPQKQPPQSGSPRRRDSWEQTETGGSILLDFLAKDIAETLTLRLHYLFCCIPLPEFIVNRSYSYSNETRNDYNSIGASTPFLHRLRRESERVQAVLVSEVLILEEMGMRAEAMMQLVLVGEHLARIRSHHALMMVASALQSQAIYRLKASWAVVEQAIPGRWDRLRDMIGLGGSKLVQGLMDRLGREGMAVGRDLRDALTVPQRYRDTALGDSYAHGLQVLLAAKCTLGAPNDAGSDDQDGRRSSCRSSGCSRGTSGGGMGAATSMMTGVPQGCPSHAACLPFVNGFITRLIRVNQSHDYVVVGPPSILNAAKMTNTGLIVATLRSCQLTAYMDLSSDPRILQLLLKPIAYVTENEQWAQSIKLEPKGKEK